jgi:hypothetical protein
MKLYPLPSREQKTAMDTAHRMRAAMAGDDEDLAIAAVHELHAQLNADHELFLAAWGYLSLSERRVWNNYCKVKT